MTKWCTHLGMTWKHPKRVNIRRWESEVTDVRSAEGGTVSRREIEIIQKELKYDYRKIDLKLLNREVNGTDKLTGI